MAKKKTDEVEENVDAAAEHVETEAAPETEVEAAAAEDSGDESAVEAAPTAEAASPEAEQKPVRTRAKKEAAPDGPVSSVDAGQAQNKGKRAEKIGIVSSDKMTNTVVVRVDRLVKHPMYRKYVKKRKKFMAHDVMGAKIGDRVRIVETRPLSARKRWRVVEIIQKAQL
ncbi:MAG: 30S ribosomal protein S17 [Blastocatellia bacterium]|nr:30S ribosomal protein S17 [Blastocatellia bacterium]